MFTFLYIKFIVSPGQVFSKIRVGVSPRVFDILLNVSLKGSTARLPLAVYECPCSPCPCQHSRLHSLKIFANLVRKEYFPLLFKLWGKSIFNFFFSLLVRLKYTYTYTHPHCVSLIANLCPLSVFLFRCLLSFLSYKFVKAINPIQMWHVSPTFSLVFRVNRQGGEGQDKIYKVNACRPYLEFSFLDKTVFFRV